MNKSGNKREKDRIRRVSELLYQASRKIRVLSSIEWPPEAKQRFLDAGGKELPQVSYKLFDASPALDAVREARRHIASDGTIDVWLARQADTLERSAHMLAAIGTPGFFEHGRAIYGEPTAPLRLSSLTPLELAQTVRDSIEQLTHVNMRIAPPAYHDATEVARDIEKAAQAHFGASAPAVELVDTLSANALASSRSIRIRRDARFTDRDALQLLNHEVFVHYTTSLNGRAQTDLPILGAGHPGTTQTQEGLAVFAEIISGSMELDRMRRLADRVFAIQMAIEGADFVEVNRYFLDGGTSPDQAFENARRVFRGGVVSGGAPFTKDVVYLFGLLRVTNTIRAIFAAGRADCLRLLFCGKMDIADIPALCELHALGLLRMPQHLPPWVDDPRYLLALLTYSSFINQMELQPLHDHAAQLLADAPVVNF